MTIELPRIISYTKIHPFDGKSITVAEGENLEVFDIKRFYCISYKNTETTKSEHAHKILQQIIIPIEGEVKIILETLKGDKFNYVLNDPGKGLFIPPFIWKRIEYSTPCVLLCLASQQYDETDYIRSYEEFKNLQI
jgi:hypothetical protein